MHLLASEFGIHFSGQYWTHFDTWKINQLSRHEVQVLIVPAHDAQGFSHFMQTPSIAV
jgi:hypothetical protein